MSALTELTAALEQNKQLNAQVASIAGLNTQISTLTAANTDLTNQLATAKADLETQKNLTAAETAKVAAKDAEIAAKEADVESRAAKKAVQIVASAGAASVTTQTAEKPADASNDKPKLTGFAKVRAAFAAQSK